MHISSQRHHLFSVAWNHPTVIQLAALRKLTLVWESLAIPYVRPEQMSKVFVCVSLEEFNKMCLVCVIYDFK